LCYRVAGAKGISPDEVSGELIYSWIDKGDKEIIEIMEDTYFDIAKYCCILYTILDPDVILIGGGISAEPRFIEGINRYAEKLAKLSVVFDKMKIDVCSFRNDSNLLGALYNFKLKYENQL
jgi:predicted NBD/HSP70 family sugar kinase